MTWLLYPAVAISFAIIALLWHGDPKRRRTIGLRAGNTVARVPTIDLAHLLVTKVTWRGDKAKDLLDVNEILGALRDAGQQVDLANVRLLVQGDAEARALIDQMDAALSEEDD